jgi:hypothetical protein
MLKDYVQFVICMKQQKNEGMIKQRWLFFGRTRTGSILQM